MKIAKILIVTFGLLLILVLTGLEVLGNWQDDGSCAQDTNCTISKKVINDTSGVAIPYANCNITIYNPSLVKIGSYYMINSSDGYYNYTINYHVLGKYPSNMFCNYTGETDTADTTFIVAQEESYNSLLYLLFILIPIGLLWIGIRWEQPMATFFSGTIFITFAISLYNYHFPHFDFMSNMLYTTFAIVMVSLGLYIMTKTIIDYFRLEVY